MNRKCILDRAATVTQCVPPPSDLAPEPRAVSLRQKGKQARIDRSNICYGNYEFARLPSVGMTRYSCGAPR